ncbi:MAG: transposase [bacterium]
MFDIEVVEQAAFMYLRSVSFNGVIAIIQSWFDKTVFSKDILIDHLERLTSSLPSNQEITAWLKPKRSGYYALDGTWMKYRGRDFVLLIIFDVVTLDVINWVVANEENETNYTKLLKGCDSEIRPILKGFFCDGDPGLLKSLRTLFSGTAIQLCVFHKYARCGQLISFKRIKNEIDREIKNKVEAVLFAKSKQDALDNLVILKRYAQEHQQNKKLQDLIGVLKRNFELLLTHFDNPEMSPYNNVLEGFNYIVKRKTNLMKGFKKPINIGRWIKIIMLDWRFHKLTESEYPTRKNKSPLEIASCELPKIYNWLKFVRQNYK